VAENICFCAMTDTVYSRVCVHLVKVLGQTRLCLPTTQRPTSTWQQCRHNDWWRRRSTATQDILRRPPPTLSMLPRRSSIIHPTLLSPRSPTWWRYTSLTYA